MRESIRYKVAEHRSKALEQQFLLQMPKKYKVILLNDDYTPMAFVVELVMCFFHLNEENATQIMLQVHLQGRGVCGVFTRDIAETKVAMVTEYARLHQHPLLCCMEPV